MKQHWLFDLSHADPGRAFGIQRTYITFEIRVSHNVDIIFRRANIGSSNIKLAHGKRRFAATILTFRSALLSGVTKKCYRAATCLSCAHFIFIEFSWARAPDALARVMFTVLSPALGRHLSAWRTGCYRARRERVRFKKRQQEERNTIAGGPWRTDKTCVPVHDFWPMRCVTST